MGERDNHIATSRALSPGGDYSHMAMVSKRWMERCSLEGTAALGAAALGPLFFLGVGAAMEQVLPSKAAAWEEENSWPL